jgi:hypothetical protein
MTKIVVKLDRRYLRPDQIVRIKEDNPTIKIKILNDESGEIKFPNTIHEIDNPKC